MTGRQVPYPGVGATLRIPRPLWDEALAIVRSYGSIRRWSEALVYFGGVIAAEDLVVTTLYAIDHEPQGGCVVVTPTQSRWLVRQLRSHDEKLIAQLHSHRGEGWHSLGDDTHATSFHNGFISIVVPYFGRNAKNITDCVVVEFEGDTFHELSPDETERRLQLCEPLQHRLAEPPTDKPFPAHQERGGPWSAFVRRLKSTVRKPR